MLLSSVNFVAKPKQGKTKVKAESKEPEPAQTDVDTECEQCKIQAKRSKTYFRFPSVRASSVDSFRDSGYSSLGDNDYAPQSDVCPKGDRVTIGTGDEYCVSVDPFFYTICMTDESRCDSTCIFRKRILHSEDKSNGRTETAIFHLDCDLDHYLTTNKDRQLELNYCPEVATKSCPDERFFQIYQTPVGQTFIQPFHHKGYYLHHMDAHLRVEKLDLNWRAPEEFCFCINFVPENSPVEPERKECTHKQSKPTKEPKTHKNNQKSRASKSRTSNTPTNTTTKDNESSQTTLHSDHSVLQQKELIHSKHKSQDKYSNSRLLSNLLFGCFSARSHGSTQSEV